MNCSAFALGNFSQLHIAHRELNMDQAATIQSIAQIIQLAVAPVFLLAGIAGFLNVLTVRFGRIVDRARIIERQLSHVQQEEPKRLAQEEITSLWHRIRLINWSIRLCVLGALMVCVVIVTLFIGDITSINISFFIAALFIIAMLLVIAGLVTFLFEVSVSTKRMRQGMEINFEDQKLE
ncbi:MAG: DUF2721 domain-containing protein [Pseudohongiellaceae bacterium]